MRISKYGILGLNAIMLIIAGVVNSYAETLLTTISYISAVWQVAGVLVIVIWMLCSASTLQSPSFVFLGTSPDPPPPHVYNHDTLSLLRGLITPLSLFLGTPDDGFNNNTGFTSIPLVVLIGSLAAATTFTGYDTAAHIAEETTSSHV